jgi:hypothetical protein
MSSQKKKIVAGIVIVLAVVVVVTVAVVLVVTRTPQPDVVGIYTGQNGREIKLAEDGTFTETALPLGGLAGNGPNHYWVSGNNITIGDAKSRPEGPPTFKIEGNNQLVGYGTVWVKQLVEPNRPSSLVGTYASSDGESLALFNNGAAYDSQLDSQREPSGGFYMPGGNWVAGKNTVTVTYPDLEMSKTLKTTYTINGKNLVGGGKELVKKSDDAMAPATK